MSLSISYEDYISMKKEYENYLHEREAVIAQSSEYELSAQNALIQAIELKTKSAIENAWRADLQLMSSLYQIETKMAQAVDYSDVLYRIAIIQKLHATQIGMAEAFHHSDKNEYLSVLAKIDSCRRRINRLRIKIDLLTPNPVDLDNLHHKLGGPSNAAILADWSAEIADLTKYI